MATTKGSFFKGTISKKKAEETEPKDGKETPVAKAKAKKPTPKISPPKTISDIVLFEKELEYKISNFKPLVEIDYPFDHEKLTHTIFGDPKSGKSVLAFARPGNILSLGFEKVGNLTLPHRRFYDSDPRIQIKSFSEHLNRSVPIYTRSCSMIIDKVKDLLLRARKLGFDWIHLDGFQETQEIAEMKMRFENGFGMTEGFKAYKKWSERTLYLNQIYSLALAAAKQGVVVTSQNVIQQAGFGEEKETSQKKEPAWKGRLMNDSDALMYTTISQKKVPGRNSFMVNVVSDKWSTFSGEENVTITTKDGFKELKKLITTLLSEPPKIKHKMEW